MGGLVSARGGEPFYEPARARLDALLELEIRRLRARYQLSLDEQRGLYISDAQVDRLLGLTPGTAADEGAAPLLEAAERLAAAANDALGRSPRWAHLVREFALTPFERDVVLLCLAPELDRRYAPICAYLNDDVTRKFATRDLALRLFTRNPAEVSAARAALAAESTLLATGLLQPVGSANEGQSWLAGGLALADAVAHFLGGVPALGGPRPPGLVTAWPDLAWRDAGTPTQAREALRRVPALRGRALVVLEGSRGSGRSRAASALAAEGEVPLVTVDAALARPGSGSLMELVRLALLHQRLHRAVLLLRGTEHLVAVDGVHASDARPAIAALAASRGTVLVSTTPETRWREAFAAARHV
jgi:hypothetical protein